ncbi:hypothetical protein G7083_11070 [Vibrio sp. HDW18]|uniref:hypothetical protein n=1 Tax=Vibrio sp. HDW18 TaxID=2714948 RepID=UPI00140E5785|nr:hypothetical protein [Vibrio sp. HDW18]QIL86340.1 hypothetical protein G7083_11070 [Vibrio sp. HDW18]
MDNLDMQQSPHKIREKLGRLSKGNKLEFRQKLSSKKIRFCTSKFPSIINKNLHINKFIYKPINRKINVIGRISKANNNDINKAPENYNSHVRHLNKIIPKTITKKIS